MSVENFETQGAIKTLSNRRKLRPADNDYEAPDGGWGWFVVVGCGFTILAIIPMFEQFGLVFIDKFEVLGITHSQTTTIFNFNLALTSCAGLFNGPIFKRFSFRQISILGSFLVVSSLFIIIWCQTFWSYLIFYGIMYGAGIGLTISANIYAVNTYFAEKRSTAMGLLWGIAGCGSIILPHVVTILLNIYGMEGSVLLFSGFSANAIMCSLLLQPVEWHTKYREETELALIQDPSITTQKSKGSSQFEKISNEIDSSNTDTANQDSKSLQNDSKNQYNLADHNVGNFFKRKWNNFIIFFELDLLNDFVYVNLMLGMSCIFFCEINYLLLVPIILKEFQFENSQIATFMSLAGVIDVVTRFFIPVITSKIRWNIRVYFLIGIFITTISRIVLIHTGHMGDFNICLLLAATSGIGKAFFIVNLALLIPSHVSLQKFPAANGIYLTTCGIFSIAGGPLVGWVWDVTKSYMVTVHVLNVFNYIATISWLIEYLRKGK